MRYSLDHVEPAIDPQAIFLVGWPYAGIAIVGDFHDGATAIGPNIGRLGSSFRRASDQCQNQKSGRINSALWWLADIVALATLVAAKPAPIIAVH